jgi:hypothetical protein
LVIINVAGYVTMFKDFLAINKKSGWWVNDPYLLAIASNMGRVGNLYASHLANFCEKDQPGEDMRLNSFRAEVAKLLNNMKSPNMRRRLFKESVSIRSPIRTPASASQRATATPLRTPSAPPLSRQLGIQSLKVKKKLSK